MTYRVIQWATGSIGKTCLRAVLDSGEHELVGLWASSAAKAGRDAGDIARRAHVGVRATNDIEEIAALDADVVLHTPLNGTSPTEHVADLERLLRAGHNVITTVGFTYPWTGNRDAAERLEAAAAAGGATLFGTGINPGLVAERLAVTATSICTSVRTVAMREVYDCAPVVSPGFIFDLCGFGRAPESFWTAAAGREAFFTELFGELLGYLGHVFGVPVDDVRPDHELAVTGADVALPAGVLPAGTVGAVRWRWRAHVDGEPVLTAQMDWRADPDAAGFEGEDGWTVEITGTPDVHLELRVSDPVGVPDRTKAIQYAVAGPVIRAIPEVVAAPPGILVLPTFAAWRSPATS